MHLRNENIPERKFAGRRIITSLTENKTGDLWREFMPQRNDIQNRIGTDLYSIEVYPPEYFNTFNPQTPFEKWAAVEVGDLHAVPGEMDHIVLPGGPYAVFLHKGLTSQAPETFRHIFQNWIPQSEFEVDERPHFEVMGTKYKNEDHSSEEEIWVPIRLRNI